MRAEAVILNRWTRQDFEVMAEAIQAEIERDDILDRQTRDFNDIEVECVSQARYLWAVNAN